MRAETVISSKDTIELVAAGDMCFSDHPLCAGFGVQSMIARHGIDFPFARIAPLLENADVVIGNLETVVANLQGETSAAFCSTPRIAAGLARNHFKIMSVANNHTLQHGDAAFYETVKHLEESGVLAVGLYEDMPFSSRPVFLEAAGQSLAFLAYSFAAENFHANAKCYARPTPKQAFADVARLKDQVDHVIVACHWGVELASDPAPGVVSLARGVIDAGARVVLGHHPHVWQAVESHREGVIFYSLGDFIFDLAWCKKCRETGLGRIFLTKGAAPRWEIVPMKINRHHQPVPSTGPARDRFLAHIRSCSESLNSIPYVRPGLRPSSEYLATVHTITARNQRAKVIHVLRNLHNLGLSRFWRIVMNKSGLTSREQ